MNFMLDTLPGLIVERAIPSDVWGRFYSEGTEIGYQNCSQRHNTH
jgi:hypothetical protein